MSDAADAAEAARARLRAAGARLRRRPARETLHALAGWLEEWRDPASVPRRALERALPAAAGFSPEVVRAGLDLALDAWTGDALLRLVERELGGPAALDAAGPAMAAPFELTATLLAGALPAPSLLAMAAPLAVRSALLVRPSSHDPVTARVAAESLAATDPELGACLAPIAFARDDTAALEAFLAADCVVAAGSDETIAALAARVRPPRRFVGYGHRVSLALLGPETLRGEALRDAAHGLAWDVALWDQLGCLSPVSVGVAADAAGVDAAAEALADALRALAPRLPRGRLDPAAAARFGAERAAAEMRAAAGRRVAVLGDGPDAFCVVREEDAALRPAPLHRFVRVQPLAAANIVAVLRPLAPHLAGVALAGFGPAEPAVVRALADLGASRICRPGRLQAPPLGWHHDGQGVLAPLVRRSDDERT